MSQGTRIEEASSTDMLEGALALDLKRSEVARAAIEDGSDSDVTMSPLVMCRLVGDRALAVRAPFGRLGLARSAMSGCRKCAGFDIAWTAGSALTRMGRPTRSTTRSTVDTYMYSAGTCRSMQYM